MTQTTLIRSGSQYFVYSWTTGVKRIQQPQRMTETDFLAFLMRLVNQGHSERAEQLLEQYCSKGSIPDPIPSG